MFNRCLLLFAFAVVSASTAHAQLGNPTSRARLWDFSVQTRYVGEQTHDGEGETSASVEADLGWGIGFGYNVNERFNVGLFFNWRSANYAATVVPEASLDEEGTTYSSWLDASTIALSADWNILPKRFTPYVSGAVGWSLIDTNIPADVYGGCWYDPWYGYVCAGDVSTYGTDAFSYSLGAGVRVELGEAAYVRIGYDYNGIDLEGTEGLDVFRLDLGFTMR
jgi:opacity protein-like surface antigen